MYMEYRYYYDLCTIRNMQCIYTKESVIDTPRQYMYMYMYCTCIHTFAYPNTHNVHIHVWHNVYKDIVHVHALFFTYYTMYFTGTCRTWCMYINVHVLLYIMCHCTHCACTCIYCIYCTCIHIVHCTYMYCVFKASVSAVKTEPQTHTDKHTHCL